MHINGDTISKAASSSALCASPIATAVENRNTLHFARQVRLISACKEAIWDAYQIRDPGSREGGELGPYESPRDDLREQFAPD